MIDIDYGGLGSRHSWDDDDNDDDDDDEDDYWQNLSDEEIYGQFGPFLNDHFEGIS